MNISVSGNAAVYVTSPSSSSAANPVVFGSVLSNLGNMWSSAENKFTLTSTHGIYYVGLAAGAISGAISGSRNIDYTLVKSGSPFANCKREFSNSWVQETTARDIMLELKSAETLHMSTTTGVYTREYSSLAIFSISAAMTSDIVAFSVSRDSLVAGDVDPVPFRLLLVNEGSAYDVFTHQVTAPSTGIYFVSFSAGGMAQQQTNITLYKNLQPFVDLRRDSTIQAGDDVLSRGIMIPLNQGDILHLSSGVNSISLSSELKETTFSV